MNYVISTFPCIDIPNMKILLKKAIWAKVRVKAFRKRFLFCYLKGGPEHGRRNILRLLLQR